MGAAPTTYRRVAASDPGGQARQKGVGRPIQWLKPLDPLPVLKLAAGDCCGARPLFVMEAVPPARLMIGRSGSCGVLRCRAAMPQG